MILTVLGVILIIAGVLIVVRKTAETWAERRAGRLNETGEKPKVSHWAIVLDRPRRSAPGSFGLRIAIVSQGLTYPAHSTTFRSKFIGSSTS